MKKLKLSHQITIIFIVAFLITSALLGVFITRRLDSIYEDNVFERLEAFGKSLRLAHDISSYESAENISFISYNSQDKSYFASDNIAEHVDEDAVKLLINKAAAQEDYITRYENIVDGRTIFYAVLNYQGFFDIQSGDVFIVLTDGTMKSQMVANTTLQIILACLLAFAFGYLIIILWITRLINDTKKISNGLKNIGNNHYKRKIQTKRKDEIGELVSSIELMRKMIIENEKNKQEIIQGVSHDLKTPIAIIGSYAQALDDNMCDTKEAVDIITKQCAKLNAKVTQLLNLTRLSYIDINNKTVGYTNIKELIREISRLYSYQTDVEIELNLASAEFFGDKESWLIAVQNIMDNAIRYAKHKIVIDLAEGELSISNDGKHIDTDTLATIFSAYKKGEEGKFGLGMSIVKRTVDLFGYDVSAENLDDDGACFRITRKQ